MSTERYRFKIGTFECVAVNDVLAFHFYPFPSLGHVVKVGEGWQWQPIKMAE
jgi:hypothetical protein